MKIHVLLSPQNVDELYFTGKTVVVIDVLRAATVIPFALANGAREIIPVNNVEFGIKVSGSAFGGQTILGGERDTNKIDGFLLGNSPLEYTRDIVEGKSIIHYTSNGTRAIVKAKFAEDLIIASFNNLTTVADYLKKKGKDFEILCAGSNGMFCIEDTVCAGKLISAILSDEKIEGEVSDSGKACQVLAKSFGRSINQMLLKSEHGMKLIENGFLDDISFCAAQDSLTVLPVFRSGIIKLLPDFELEDEN